MRIFLLLLLVAPLAGGPVPMATAEASGWETYENSTLLENDFNDGDSFHVLAEGNTRRHYIFRLYFVDTPETDSRIPERLEEQGAYWSISPEKVVKLGEEAATFTRKLLSKSRFTVYTQKHNARGQSDKRRYYAMIEIDGKFLSTILVEEGLARIYGLTVELPDGTRAKRHRSRLAAAEKKAKEQGKGGWKDHPDANRKPGIGRVPSPAGQPITPQAITLTRTVLVYSTKPPHRAVGRLRAGLQVSVLEGFSPTRARVRFTLNSGKTYEALCNRVDLGL